MTLLIAFDDTDARDGMCTTWLAARVREAFPEFPQARLPRLVRLNPNVPWKTRGNAAVALALQDDDTLELDAALSRARDVVARHARLDAPGTEPGIAVARRAPPRPFYERVVRDVVTREDAVSALDVASARYDGMNGGRGLIGAAAALAWTPEDKTFELIAYRDRERWGTPRDVPEEDVRAIDLGFGGTFDSYDHENDEVVMVPASPCPVLFGIRGDHAEELPRALATVGGERAVEWTLFETNQGTDDHLQPATCGHARALTSVVVTARTASRPRDVGGHVFVELEDATGRLRAAAYAPTVRFRDTVRALREGDAVVACGGVKPGPDGRLTLAIEKLHVNGLARPLVKTANPDCPTCGKAMKSAGSGAGYRCRACRTRAPEEAARFEDEARTLTEGWHEVPARARRHLAKPLKRGAPTVERGVDVRVGPHPYGVP